MAERLKAQYGLDYRPVAEAKAKYPADNPSYMYGTLKAAFVSSAALAERKSAQPAAVYMYVWEGRTAVDGGMMRAPHTTEIPFAFDNVALGPMLLGTAPATLARPAPPGPPSPATAIPMTRSPACRPRYDATARATMMFNTKSRIENAPTKASAS